MNAGVEIRNAAPADAGGIVALNDRVAAEAPFFLAYDIDPVTGADMLQAKLARGPGGDGVLVAAAGAGRIVGMLMLRRHLHPAFAGVLQTGLAVDPDWRRQGVARLLLRAAIAQARAGGARRIQAAVVDGNAGSLALFEGEGFRAEGRLRRAALVDGAAHDVIPLACEL